MSFKRYNSIENSYQNKVIMKAISIFPELKTCKYVVQEKLDGANIQLYFEPNKEMRVGKRSGFINKDDNFNNIWNVLLKYQDTLNKFQSVADETGDTFRLYGEIVGPSINRRVNYGEENTICFFDLEMNGFILTPENFEHMMKHMGIKEVVPVIGYFDDLFKALDVPVEFDSKYINIPNNPSEGVVIRPYGENSNMGDGTRFILKKKSKAFAEKESKAHKTSEPPSNDVLRLQEEFKSYINNNRILSCFSKEGEIKDIKELGKYIKLIQQDAQEDFLKDNELPATLTEKELKLVFNAGGLIANMLRGYL